MSMRTLILISENLKVQLELSNSGLKNIEGLIKGEYEIDRNEFLEK